MLTQADQARIVELLEHFDCSAKETLIYTQCLQSGHASIQQIARVMNENRFTIHSAVEQLIQKGLLYETRKGKRRMIGAEEPEVLYRLLDRKYNELEALKVNLDYGTKILHSIKPTDSSRPTVRFYDGSDGLKNMLEETLSATGEILLISNVDLLAKLVGADYLEEYYRRRASKGIHTRLIFPSNARFAKRVRSKARDYKIQFRFLPSQYKWQSGIFSWNQSLSLLSYADQKVTCTIIENADLAHFYRSVDFELSWQQAEEE